MIIVLHLKICKVPSSRANRNNSRGNLSLTQARL